jgi:hypothetical protein
MSQSYEEAHQGPPLQAAGSYDDVGLLINFNRKCSHPGCDVNLTSRNRWHRRWLCIEHGREMLREAAAGRRRAAGVLTRAEMAAAAARDRQADAAGQPVKRPAVVSAPAVAPRLGGSAVAAAPRLDLGLLRLPLDLQAALTAWLYAPGDDHTEGALRAALRDYELKHRLMRAIR